MKELKRKAGLFLTIFFSLNKMNKPVRKSRNFNELMSEFNSQV